MPKGKPNKKWLEFTEERNSLDYLEKAYRASQNVVTDPFQWKWVIVGLHSALYGFSICALKGSNWERVARQTKAGQRLISFGEAIKRSQSFAHMGFYTHSKPLQLTPGQEEAIRWFKSYRDRFEHYVPMFWLIEMHDLAMFGPEVLDVIRFLALDSGNVRLSEHERGQVDAWTRKAKQNFQGSQLYKDYLAAKKALDRRKLKQGASQR